MFLMALTLAYVSKALSGAYMISMLMQIERQFGIPTSIVGLINGSFEIGELNLCLFTYTYMWFGCEVATSVNILMMVPNL